MSTILRVAAVAFVAVADAAPVLAQGAGQGPVATACKAEIEKLCSGKQHVGGEVRACLEAKKAEVSADCKTALDSTGPGKGQGGPGAGKAK